MEKEEQDEGLPLLKTAKSKINSIRPTLTKAQILLKKDKLKLEKAKRYNQLNQGAGEWQKYGLGRLLMEIKDKAELEIFK